jgi:hypothetical protein
VIFRQSAGASAGNAAERGSSRHRPKGTCAVSSISMKRGGQPDEIGSVALLASDAKRLLTGSIVIAEGRLRDVSYGGRLTTNPMAGGW